MPKQPNSRNGVVWEVRSGARLEVRFYDTVDHAGAPEPPARFTVPVWKCPV